VRLFRKAKEKAKGAYRLFFATDLHGSDRCFAKFLAAARAYEADALVMGGDVAGKGIVPIVALGNGRFQYTFQGETKEISEEEVDQVSKVIRFNGLYPWVGERRDVEELEDHSKRDALFAEVIQDQARRWCALATERLPEHVRCIITPGNDDPYVLDDVLRSSERVECPEEAVIQLGPFWMGSLGTTNRTPWDSEREADENDLTAKIDRMFDQYNDGRPLWFNFHVPPFGSGLDTAALLRPDLRPVVERGMVVTGPVGSTAVRQAVVRYRPRVGLFGHIHEATGACKIGPTLCLNPGSDYSSGLLKGALVQVDEHGDPMGYLLTSG
jgi:Icc-related predicted phosphoesterase